MKNLWKASALLGVAALAACAEKPRSEPAYAPAVVAQQPEVPDSVRIRESVLRQAAERTGIAGEWEVKKVYLDGSKVPLCNCKHGDYLIAISPGDTARAFFSQRGEYLSSITTVASDDTARTRRLASPKESTDRVQKRVGGKWMFDHDRETIADTVFKISP